MAICTFCIFVAKSVLFSFILLYNLIQSEKTIKRTLLSVLQPGWVLLTHNPQGGGTVIDQDLSMEVRDKDFSMMAGD